MTNSELLIRQFRLMFNKLQTLAVEKAFRSKLRQGSPKSTDSIDFVVFYADGPSQIYQLNQWTAPFEALRNRGYGVCLIAMNALSARQLAKQTALPILQTRSMDQIETALLSWGTAGIFYVNNSQANFTMLRVNGPAHVHLSHGESEKSSMVSNQLKAYDFAFIAGQAARNRILSNVPRFDPTNLVEIGRPQLDVQCERAAAERPTSRIRVLYAPTWEGDGQNMAYSSITAIGESLVSELLNDKRFTVIFRPHPKTGSCSAKARSALVHIEKAIAVATHTSPEAGHRVDTAGDSTPSILESDIVLCDISAIAMDCVGLDVALLLFHNAPTTMSQKLTPGQALATQHVRQLLDDDHGSALLNAIAALGTSGPLKDQRSLRNNVFGDPALGRATERFIDAAVALTDTEARE
ncbi:CDP-glycerol glycerophosphotransferase family protein [Paeniglutamicibacter psychrophenolicus]|uniref:CDP-glycerol glycerophosphotransferase family protein n=1 Tax=Paeniglutamicibacter psychrophenolicus TaxID=257454 RepID=UPI002787F662|nr:CDP-glycerol glycerophosphotransferase family protein [Paeniglutamicibacter psychrophenolicus]MDQ0096133.1 hypothetical protein [Paeniglutamicibacter psychrophenolicus]